MKKIELPGGYSHGLSGYNEGCRCPVCVSEKATAYARWCEKVRATGAWEHGTSTGYNVAGCRCDDCRSWARRRNARYRKVTA